MSFGIFLAVLLAAVLHASWNALIKVGQDKASAMTVLSVIHAVIALPMILVSPLPEARVWPWLLGSAGIHFAYQMFLMLAYQHGDLSRVYPIARGAAPVMVLIVSPLILPDRLSPAELGGILLVALGIAAMGMMGAGILAFAVPETLKKE